MKFPNITYHGGSIQKITSLEVSLCIAYLDFNSESPTFITSDRQIIYLYIYQHPLRNEFKRFDKFDELMTKALINCKEIPADLRASYENWTGWSFEVKESVQCTKNEVEMYHFDQNERLLHELNGLKTKRSEEYFDILTNEPFRKQLNLFKET
tara:strand:- start:863 stop:1321 length:459 start_codon:yes stop_codon:yes gene_type:complete